MANRRDEDVLAGFLDEVRGYLPIILQRIEAYQADPKQLEAMKEAYRYSHSIKGSASMIDLPGLSLIASYLEEVLEEFASTESKMGKRALARLRKMVVQIELFIDGLGSGNLNEQRLIKDATYTYRRMRGLPKDEDKEAEERAIQKCVKDVDTTSVEEKKSTVSPPDATTYQEDISPELLDIFRMEAEEHMQSVTSQLAGLIQLPSNSEALQAVRRSVHTLKGASGTVGLSSIAHLTHRMEDLLDRLSDERVTIDALSMDLLFDSSDTLEDMLSGGIEKDRLHQVLRDLYRRYSVLLDDDAVEGGVDEPGLFGEGGILDLEKLPTLTEKTVKDETSVTVSGSEIRKPTRIVRVPLERLDELVKLVSELVISRSAFELRMRDLAREVEELGLSSERLRRISSTIETNYEVRALGGRINLFGGTSGRNAGVELGSVDIEEFDELQFDRYTEFHLLSRELTETSSDIRTLGIDLNNLIADFDGLLNRHRRLSSQIQDELMRTRMVPLDTLTSRLYRTVRVLSREQGKLIDLIIEGEEIELDTTVLDKIVDPLLHLLRNAVDHGIETPDVRVGNGKPERGRIDLRAYAEGNEVIIQVRDDGAGLEPELIRSVALSKGFISQEEEHRISDDEIYALVFMSGFSTAGEISEISGRGVGLDVVRTNVENLKGTVSLVSSPGENTTYTIRLPMTLAVTRAILVRVDEETFAIPQSAVTQILRLDREQIEYIDGKRVFRMGDQRFSLLYLGEVLNLKQRFESDPERMPVLILKAGDKEAGMVVDQLLTGREIVIKPLGTHLRRVHGVTGATLLGDGSVVLILNPADLIAETPRVEERIIVPDQPAPEDVEEGLSIMIVDDSLSVRRVVSKLIRHAGWQPVEAKDGIEALEILQQTSPLPDLIIVDIEMPRMDGFELISTLKAHESLKYIPLVVLTSRAGGKHRSKALEIGAAGYIVKPYQDKELLQIIRDLAHQSADAFPM